MDERRRFKRYNAAIEAKYTKVEGCTTISSLCTTKNLSLGGVCTTMSRLVKNGDELLVELFSPYDEKRTATLAKVVWVKEFGQSPYNICGLQFLWVSSQPFLKDCFKTAQETPVFPSL